MPELPRGIGGWAACLALALAIAGCAREATQLAITGEALGTTWSVKVSEPPPGLGEPQARQAVAAALAQVDAQMSTYREDSELSRFNRAQSTDWLPVSPDTVAVVAEAQRIAALSQGALDVTVGPLVNLWGFGPDPIPDEVPDAAAVASARERVGYEMLAYRLQPPALRKARPDLYVDLSAIAKGYAVDRAAAALERHGATDYLVEVGGELRSRGRSPRGDGWRVAIERPIPGQRTVERVILPGDNGLATSGDYRHYFEQDGRRYSHTIDPSTGQPIAHTLASVTVVHPSATTADGLATALLVLGPERGAELSQALGLAVLMIIRSGNGFEERSSSAFAPHLSDTLE